MITLELTEYWFIVFDGAKLYKSLVINAKNKTKSNRIGNNLTF